MDSQRRPYSRLVPTPQVGTTFRAGRLTRCAPYIVMGIMLAICLGIGIPSVDAAHTGSTAGNIAIMTVVSLGAVAITGLAILPIAGAYTGATTLRRDGVLVTKPRRDPLLLTWHEIDQLKVDVLTSGKGTSVLGLKAVVSGKEILLPGIMRGGSVQRPIFEEQVQAIESAWQSARAASIEPTKSGHFFARHAPR